jgi:hypothetical protein
MIGKKSSAGILPASLQTFKPASLQACKPTHSDLICGMKRSIFVKQYLRHW